MKSITLPGSFMPELDEWIMSVGQVKTQIYL
ncbi:hypothetical protein HmCmsJML010_03811 [Escherichia coli]|nr:hypothetical protein HMPREF0864_04686 [Enterobacteriaceae bacterium 9_2_54FAA]CNL21286.1 Uncharacterised protein [Yersinia frederiksenii]VVY71839.1 Uncharacterised protein [Escherichia coli]VVY73044.1 Uncharacterised protein [Escherichia coli]VVY73105.1 Uncharacterised protein [Escherichia coli]